MNNAGDPPIDDRPIALRPETFGRFEGEIRYVEGLIRTRAPRPNWNRFPGLKPGAWGLLAAGASIGGASGLALGTGTVTLCTQEGSTLTDTGIEVPVVNGGPQINATPYAYYASGIVVRLAWTEGAWAVNCWRQAGSGAYGYY